MRDEQLILRTAKVFRRQRLRRGITQIELAARANISLNSLGFLETGRNGPRLTNFVRIANALEIPAWQLLKEITDG